MHGNVQDASDYALDGSNEAFLRASLSRGATLAFASHYSIGLLQHTFPQIDKKSCGGQRGMAYLYYHFVGKMWAIGPNLGATPCKWHLLFTDVHYTNHSTALTIDLMSYPKAVLPVSSDVAHAVSQWTVMPNRSSWYLKKTKFEMKCFTASPTLNPTLGPTQLQFSPVCAPHSMQCWIERVALTLSLRTRHLLLVWCRNFITSFSARRRRLKERSLGGRGRQPPSQRRRPRRAHRRPHLRRHLQSNRV
jgi:hypothetical protein